MSLGKNIVSGLKWVLLEKTAVQLGTFIVFMYLARVLGPEMFGLVALAKIFIDLADLFAQQGVAQALVQRQQVVPQHYDSAFWFNITIAVLAIILFYFGSSALAELYAQVTLEPVLQAMCIVIACNGLVAVQNAKLRKEMKFRQMAMRTLIASSISNVLAIALAMMGYGVWSLVWREIARALLSAVLIWYISGWRPGLRFSLPHFLELYGFGIHVFANNLVNYLVQKSDGLIIGFFLTVSTLGYYNVSQRLLKIANSLISQTVGKVALPAFARIQHDTERLQSTLLRMTRLTTLVAFPIFLLMSLLAEYFTIVLFGEKWAPSIPLMEVVVLMGIARTLTYPINSMIFGVGNPALANRILLIEAVARVGSVLLAVQVGIVATAWSVTAVSFAVLPIWLWGLRRVLPISWSSYLQALTPALAGSLIMVVALVLAKLWILPEAWQAWTQLILLGTAGVVIYVATIAVCFPQTRTDLITQLRGRKRKQERKKVPGVEPESDNPASNAHARPPSQQGD